MASLSINWWDIWCSVGLQSYSQVASTAKFLHIGADWLSKVSSLLLYICLWRTISRRVLLSLWASISYSASAWCAPVRDLGLFVTEGRDCQPHSAGWGLKQGKCAVWAFVLASSLFKGGFALSTHTAFWDIHGILCPEILSTVNVFFWWEGCPPVMPFLPSQGESLESWSSHQWKRRGSVLTVSPALSWTCPKIWNLQIFPCTFWHWQTKPFSIDWVIILTKEWSQLVSNSFDSETW